MLCFYEKVKESSDFIESKISNTYNCAIILGSGLSDLVNHLDIEVSLDYSQIPNFPKSTVKGHKGRILFGKIANKRIIVFEGRFHHYEGYSMKEVAYPMFVCKLLGVEKVILTNSCGGLNIDLSPGALMIINDYINLVSSNPLIGANDERFGERFPDMSAPYDKDYINLAIEVAKENNIKLFEGVYCFFGGPCYETISEINYMSKIGADAVGMSTVPETIAGNYLGLKIIGICCITNMATGIQKVKHSHENVLEMAQKASVDFVNLLRNLVEKL